MKRYDLIQNIIGREILDSRGNPTVEAEVILAPHFPITDVLSCLETARFLCPFARRGPRAGGRSARHKPLASVC